eukprot:m.22401 g.22401  ORF g.22401 m.22401 type:complete len:597 (-) comp8836_c0_seq1:2086-3876(-)
MSSKLLETYLPTPDCKRGKPFNISADPKGKYMLYPHNRVIVAREIEDPSKGYVFTGHVAETTVAKFAPSGFYIASADVTGRVLIWDTTQEEHAVKYEYRPLGGAILDLQWSPDSKRIVVSGNGGELFCHAFLWDSGSSVGKMIGHTKVANSIDFRMQRPFRSASASDDGKVCFYHGPPFKLDHKSSNHSNFVNAVRFSPDGAFMASAAADGKVFLYDGKTGETIAELKDGDKAHTRGIYGLAWSPCSTRVMSCSADATVKVWDAENKELFTTFKFEDSVDNHQLGCLWQGETLISVSLNGNINYLNLASPDAPSRVVIGHSKAITAVASTVDSGVAYTSSYDGKVCKFDLSTGIASAVGNAFDNSVLAMSIGSNGVTATTVSDNFAVIPSDGNAFGDHDSVESTPNGVSSSGDVTVIACVNSLKVVGGDALEINYQANCCAVNGDGSEVAVGGEDKKIHIYTISGGSLTEKTTIDMSGAVFALAYSPDNQWLASGDSDRYVNVYSAVDFSHKMDRWRTHSARVNTLAWSPNSRHIASGGLDSAVMIWDMEKEMKKIKILRAHVGFNVTSVAWTSPNTILSGGQDAVLRVFEITPFE